MGLHMSSYLSKPETEKISSDEETDKLKSGASSMQGWRVTQEDAHNCILDFDVNTALFAVYDGHGGHEVALYCSQKLPQYIKDTGAYKDANMEKALIDAFLGFDATIATSEVITELKKIAGVKKGDNDSGSSDVEENVSNLYEEAEMPLEQVIEKYTSNLKHPNLLNLQKDGGKQPVSPYLRARTDTVSIEACSSVTKSSGSENLDTHAAECPVSSSSNIESGVKTSNNEANTLDVSSKTVEEIASLKKPEIHIEFADSSGDVKENKTGDPETPKNNEADTNTSGDQPNQNGEVQTTTTEKSQENSGVPQENGEIGKKGKGKATTKTKGVPKPPTMKTRPKRNAQQLYSKLLEFESESDSEDEEDKTFQGPNEESTTDEEGPNASNADNDNSEASSEDNEEELDEEEDLEDMEEEEDECAMDEADQYFAENMREEPGSDSGCTAVVALIRGNQLFVANAGDSRCIVCRNGKAVEMSFDHKPEDKQERERVVKAGGRVTFEGRVNGGLNLSRAIGDHAYKQKKELSDREQMITALPDVRTLTINPGEDEFMVLACDGIWNFMSSQEVVDFVKPKIEESPEKLSQICEEMFEHCLASNTLGDGTGCDNMTAIIVQFKTNLCKRPAEFDDVEESGNSKHLKTDENLSQPAATA